MTELTLVSGHTVRIVDRGGETVYRTEADEPLQKVKTPNGTFVYPVGVDFSKFDPVLFNVDFLVDQGYADETSRSIPLIVTQKRETRTVAYSDSTERSETDVVERTENVEATATLELIDAQAGVVKKEAASAAYAELARKDSVEGVWLDTKVELELDEAPSTIDADTTRESYGVSGSGVNVSVIDTGIDDTHPDLNGSVVLAKDFTGEGTTQDSHGHGTHVAGTLAGDGTGNASYVGVAPNASLFDARVIDSDGRASTSSIVDAINWSVDSGADVISMSLGSGRPTLRDRSSDPYTQAVNAATERGVVVVVAAGNYAGFYSEGYRTVSSPGTQAGAITVGASDGDGSVAGFSSRGPTPVGLHLKPSLVAPGVDVTAAEAGTDGYTTMSGTSMATPMVSGVAALVLEKHSGLTPTEVKDRLMATSDIISGDVYVQGAGRVNASRAVDPGAVVSPAENDFGSYSTNTSASRVVTVTNTADGNRTLNLSAGAVNVIDGSEATVALNRTTVRLGSGESADLTLRVYTNTSVGPYSGRIVADGGEYTATFGFSRTHAVTVEKEAIAGTDVGSDTLLFVGDKRSSFTVNGRYGFAQLTDGTATFQTYGGTYHAVSSGLREDSGQPVLVTNETTVTGSSTVVLNESRTTEIDFDTSALNGSLTPRGTNLYYEKETSDVNYLGAIQGTSASANGVRVSRDPTLSASIEQVVTSNGSSTDAFDAPEVYYLFYNETGIDGPTTVDVDPSTYARKDVVYHRSRGETTYDVSFRTLTSRGYDRYFDLTFAGGIGDRTEQSIHLHPEFDRHGISVDGTTASGSYDLPAGGGTALPDGDTVRTTVNEHPYSGTIAVGVDATADEASVVARPQHDRRRAPFVDSAPDTYRVLHNGTVVREFDSTAGRESFETGFDEGTEVEIQTVGRNGVTESSTRTVVNASFVYDSSRENRLPGVRFLGVAEANTSRGIGPSTNAPNGSLHAYFAVDEPPETVENATLLYSRESVESVPFGGSGVNSDTRWTETATRVHDMTDTTTIYSAEVNLSGYSGDVNLAFRAENDVTGATEKTLFDGFTVRNFDPISVAASNKSTVNASRPIAFAGHRSVDNLGISGYEWRFPDGTTVPTEFATTEFATLGDKTVDLTVTDANGRTSTASVTVRVIDEISPTASVSADSATVPLDETVTFDGTDSTDNHEIAAYRWDFDDGTGSSGAEATHAFSAPGTYDVELAVEDRSGNTATTTETVEVEDETPPSASVSVDRTDAEVGLTTVELDASDSSDNYRVAEYRWDLTGDGRVDEVTSTPVLEHQFGTLGPRRVGVIAVDTAGNADSANTSEIAVDDTTAPTAAIAAPDAVTVGSETTLDGSGSEDNHGIAAYRWDLDGDGNVTETGATVSHAFEETGTTEVTLEVVDESGHVNTSTAEIQVEQSASIEGGGGSGGGGSGSSGGGGGGSGSSGGGSSESTSDEVGIDVTELEGRTVVSVGETAAGREVEVDLDGPASASSTGVSGVGIAIQFDSDGFRFEISDPSDEVPADVPELTDGAVVNYFTADAIGIEHAYVGNVEFRFTVASGELPEGADRSDVTLYRYSDGNWEALDTEHVGGDEYVADSPGFSAFAVGVDARVDETTTGTRTGTPIQTSAGSETTAETPSVTEAETPGFGVLVALIGLVAGVLLAAYRD